MSIEICVGGSCGDNGGAPVPPVAVNPVVPLQTDAPVLSTVPTAIPIQPTVTVATRAATTATPTATPTAIPFKPTITMASRATTTATAISTALPGTQITAIGIFAPTRVSQVTAPVPNNAPKKASATAIFGQAQVFVGRAGQLTGRRQTPLPVVGATVRGRFERWSGNKRVFSQDVLALSNKNGMAQLRTTVSWAARDPTMRFCLVSITMQGVTSVLSANDRRCVMTN